MYTHVHFYTFTIIENPAKNVIKVSKRERKRERERERERERVTSKARANSIIITAWLNFYGDNTEHIILIDTITLGGIL